MIKERNREIDILNVIEKAGVQLTQRGDKYKGSCPFHSENNPSFYVFPDGHYHCFGCQAHGDAIDSCGNFMDMVLHRPSPILG